MLKYSSCSLWWTEKMIPILICVLFSDLNIILYKITKSSFRVISKWRINDGTTQWLSRWRTGSVRIKFSTFQIVCSLKYVMESECLELFYVFFPPHPLFRHTKWIEAIAELENELNWTGPLSDLHFLFCNSHWKSSLSHFNKRLASACKPSIQLVYWKCKRIPSWYR